VFLQFVSSGTFQLVAGELEGIKQPTVCKVIQEVRCLQIVLSILHYNILQSELQGGVLFLILHLYSFHL